MPVFNSYTRPTALGDTFKPIDDNIQLLGAQTMYNRAEQNAQKIGGQFSNLFGVTTYGKDAEVLSQIEDEARKQIQEISKGNLENPETVSRVNSLISQYKNHPDVQAVTQRAAKYNNDVKQIKDLEEKGKFVPAWKMKSVTDAEKYFNSGEYLTDKRFNGQVRAGFDWDKHNKDIIASTPEVEMLKKSGVNNDLYKGKTYNALQGKFYEGLNQPGALDDLREQFEYNYGNEDYSSHDQQTAVQQVEKLQNIIATSNDPILKQQAINDLEYWKDFSSSVNPEVSKEEAFQRYLRANAEDFARTNTNYALKESKMSDANKMYQEHTYRMQEKAEKDSLRDYALKLAVKATLDSGKTPDYEAIDNGDLSSLVYNPLESRDGKSGSPANGKTLEQKTEEDAQKAEEERIKKIPVLSLAQIQQEFSSNKTFEENFKKLLADKGYTTNWLTNGDIENAPFDEKTQSYKITVDNAFVGSSKIIDIPKQEFEKLKEKKTEGYEFNGKNLTQSDIEEAAKASNMTVEEYLSKSGVKKK